MRQKEGESSLSFLCGQDVPAGLRVRQPPSFTGCKYQKEVTLYQVPDRFLQ